VAALSQLPLVGPEEWDPLEEEKVCLTTTGLLMEEDAESFRGRLASRCFWCCRLRILIARIYCVIKIWNCLGMWASHSWLQPPFQAASVSGVPIARKAA
jgi:hypothetical protein